MSDTMAQEEAMNMCNEQAAQILIPMRNMMCDQNGCPISDAVFALDKAIEVLSAGRPQVEWTPITKGLPKEPGIVLITHISPLSPSGREVVSAWLDDDGLFYDTGRGTMMYLDVLAWAYPPKPYMGELDDN